MWQPIPAILMVLLAPVFFLKLLNAVVHHQPTTYLILSALLFGAAGTIQLVLVHRHRGANR